MVYNIYIAVLIICFICSLVSFKLNYAFHLKLFSVIIGITVVTEICANFLPGIFRLTNYPVYNIFTLIEYPLIAYYFKRIISSGTTKRLIDFFLWLYPLFWLFTIIFIFGISGWNSYVIMAGDLFTVCISARYMYELFTSNRLISFKTCPEFWIAAATIFYFSCELPITGILNYLVHHYIPLTLQLYTVLQVLNIIMYSIYIYAFLCKTTLITKSSYLS